MYMNSVCLMPLSLMALSARDCWLCYFTSPKHPLTLSGPDGQVLDGRCNILLHCWDSLHSALGQQLSLGRKREADEYDRDEDKTKPQRRQVD